MVTIPAIGTKVWANIVFPGMIVQTDTGERVEVQTATTGYDTVTFDTGTGRKATVNYADRVQVLGYFNPS